MQETFAIGALSRESGVKIPTIRYYESIGLLPRAPRSAGNRRLYEGPHLERLRFIRYARGLGFDIDAIRELLDLAEQPQRSCSQVDGLARAHLAAVSRRIEHLQNLEVELKRMISACPKGRTAQCHILQVLGDV